MATTGGSFSAEKLVRTAVANLEKVLKEAEIETEKGMSDIGIEVVNAVRRSFSAGGGRTYRRRGRVHVASAPGRPPAVDTGRLRASYAWRTGKDAGGPFVEVGSNVEYAPFLEFGTRRMAARPHLRPAVNELISKIPGMVAEAWAHGCKVAIGRMPTQIDVS